MERYRRGKGKRKLLGSHQRCWIWGRNAVLETLASGRWPMLDLYLALDLPPERLEQALSLARRAGIEPRQEPGDHLTTLCHAAEHQGYAARMSDFPYWIEEEVLERFTALPLCVVLDGVQDPYNFGAIVRSAEVLGVEAVFIAAQGQTGVTSMAVRSSAGAVSRVPIARVESLPDLLGRLKARGLRVVAASEKADRLLEAFDFTGAAAIVIGNEGGGIEPAVMQLCDAVVRIPQSGRIGSLNAAVAASVFFYEAGRQRRKR